MHAKLRILARSFIMCAVVQLSAGRSDDVISVCLGPYCYTAPTRNNSEHAFKSKAEAKEWCSKEGRGELVSINSQSEQDDIDRVRFSEPDLDDDSYFIETKATFSAGGVVCWPNAQGLQAASATCRTSMETLNGLVVQKDTQSVLTFYSKNLQTFLRFICQVSREDGADCPAGLFQNGNFCFNYSADTERHLSWLEARRRCMQQGGGDLAYIGVDSLTLGNASQWPGLPPNTSTPYWTGVRTGSSPERPSEGDTVANIKRTQRTGEQSHHDGKCTTLSPLPSTWATANCSEKQRFICRRLRDATSTKRTDTTTTKPVTPPKTKITPKATYKPPIMQPTNHAAGSSLPFITPDGRYTTAMDLDLNPAGSGLGGGATRGHDALSTQSPGGRRNSTLIILIVLIAIIIVVLIIVVIVLLKRNRNKATAAAYASVSSPSTAASSNVYESIPTVQSPSINGNRSPLGCPASSPAPCSTPTLNPAPAPPSATLYASVVRKNGTTEESRGATNEYANMAAAPSEQPPTVYAELTFVGDAAAAVRHQQQQQQQQQQQHEQQQQQREASACVAPLGDTVVYAVVNKPRKQN